MVQTIYYRGTNIGIRGERMTNSECKYLLGLAPPRYPVPALMDHDPWNYAPQRLVDLASMKMAAVSYAGY